MIVTKRIFRNFKSKKFILLSLVLVLFILFYFKNINSYNSLTNLVEKTKTNDIPQKQKLINQRIENEDQNEIDVEFEKQLVSEKEYEKQIGKDLQKQQIHLGENGKIASLSDEEAKEIGEKQLAVIALNEELSETISYNRTAPDVRHPSCKNKIYDVHNLPTTSVIVIFFNEPYSVLVRTAHSAINTAPGHLLKEIILVDDGSTNVELKGKLDYYVKTRLSPKVKVLRLKNRQVKLFTFQIFMCETLSFFLLHFFN